MMTRTALHLKIDGMHCEACVRRVTLALKKLQNVQPEQVAIGEANVAYDASSLQPQAIIDALSEIGFHATVAE